MRVSWPAPSSACTRRFPDERSMDMTGPGAGRIVSGRWTAGAVYFLPMPRTLPKKLEKMVWNPSTMNKAPGMATRIIWA